MRKIIFAFAFVCLLNVLPIVAAPQYQVIDRYFVLINGYSNIYGGQITQSGTITLARTIPDSRTWNGVNPIEVLLQAGTPALGDRGGIWFMTNSSMKPDSLSFFGSVDLAYVFSNENDIYVFPDPRLASFGYNSFYADQIQTIANGLMKLRLSPDRSRLYGSISVKSSSFLPAGNTYVASISGFRLNSANFSVDLGGQETGKLNPQLIESLAKDRSESLNDASANIGPCEQTIQINYGQTVNEQLSSTDCQLSDGSYVDFYVFNGTQGQQVTLTMNSSQLDSYLILFNNNNFAFLDDDSGGGTNSRIIITLPETGTYFIGANSFDPNVFGNYSLTLTQGGGSCSQATAISFGQNANGQLTASDCRLIDNSYIDFFVFTGTQGQRVTITMNSSQIDTYLILFNATGFYVENDDGGSDTNSRIIVTLPSNGVYVIGANSYAPNAFGNYTVNLSTAIPKAAFDFDGDRRSDISVFRPSNGSWYVSQSANDLFYGVQFGANGDVIVPADFDGDGRSDISVFRAGVWYRLNSSNNQFVATQFGSPGDVPVPGDFDTDGRADIAVFRPSNGTWYWLNSSNGQFKGAQFGTNGDKPQIGDFDGDGRTDLAVYRPATGIWYILRSSNNLFLAVKFGLPTDFPTAADFDGDGKSDIAVFRPSTGGWYILKSSSEEFLAVNFGIAEDKPVPADYDGDGRSDIAVFRPSTGNWYLLRSTSGFTAVRFGISEDKPTPHSFVR